MESNAITIRLGRSGRMALVDLSDYERVSAYSWHLRTDTSGRVCAATFIPGTKNPRKSMTMHRFIVGAEPGQRVDHVDGDPLHNRRENLRLATNSQNIANSKKYQRKGRPATSKFKGVCRAKDRWMAQITVSRRKMNLGKFSDEQSAALAYDMAARSFFGQFARLNFPEASC